MAEVLLRELLARRLGSAAAGVQVLSAGTHAASGQPANALAVQLLASRGYDMRGHRSRPLTPALVREADLILTMTLDQKDEVLALAPEASSRIFTLKEFAADLRHLEALRVRRAVLREIVAASRKVAAQRDPEPSGPAEPGAGPASRLPEEEELEEVEAGLARADIEDPLGKGIEAYEGTLAQLEEALEQMLQRLAGGGWSGQQGASAERWR